MPATTKYWVYSQEKDGEPVLELKRTDRKVAEQDAGIINDMFRRKAWVEEGT